MIVKFDDQGFVFNLAVAFNFTFIFSTISMIDDIREGFIDSRLDGIKGHFVETSLTGNLFHIAADFVETIEITGEYNFFYQFLTWTDILTIQKSLQTLAG